MSWETEAADTPGCPGCGSSRATGMSKGDEPTTWSCPDCGATWVDDEDPVPPRGGMTMGHRAEWRWAWAAANAIEVFEITGRRENRLICSLIEEDFESRDLMEAAAQRICGARPAPSLEGGPREVETSSDHRPVLVVRTWSSRGEELGWGWEVVHDSTERLAALPDGDHHFVLQEPPTREPSGDCDA